MGKAGGGAARGSFKAQLDFNAPSIGGKDSMSGSFESLDVPPTLVNFAITVSDARTLISPEFKKAEAQWACCLRSAGAGAAAGCGGVEKQLCGGSKSDRERQGNGCLPGGSRRCGCRSVQDVHGQSAGGGAFRPQGKGIFYAWSLARWC